VLGLRPESFEDAAFAVGTMPTIEVDVEVVEEIGSDTYVFFRVEAPRITAEVLEATDDDRLIAEERTLFSARVDPRTDARVGSRLVLALDPARFHFFDPQTGEGLLRTAEPAPAVAVPA
jgi:multiple sugar transport system ATP-binding protein